MNIQQNYNSYLPIDHEVWAVLFSRQNKAILDKASKEYQKGFRQLTLDPYRVARLDEVNEKLEKACGWTVVGASGLVSNKDFFNLLINRKFPINLSMRRPEELEFSELPDIFHDIYGHLPMLMNPLFCEFMEEYSALALEFIDDDVTVSYFARLYWFTLEMGLVLEDGVIKPYGGAIMTSANEIENICNPLAKKHPFDLIKVISTEYDNLKLQREYFVINSFQQLFDSLYEIKSFISESCASEIKLVDSNILTN